MKAFFDKLTGTTDEEETGIDLGIIGEDTQESWSEPEEDEELHVDVYQDENNIYIKAFIPGVSPAGLDIDISRDMVSVRGQKFRESTIEDENYFQQELKWGTFSRKILLPREIDIETAEAHSKDGLISLVLPKIDKDRRAKLQVKSR